MEAVCGRALPAPEQSTVAMHLLLLNDAVEMELQRVALLVRSMLLLLCCCLGMQATPCTQKIPEEKYIDQVMKQRTRSSTQFIQTSWLGTHLTGTHLLMPLLHQAPTTFTSVDTVVPVVFSSVTFAWPEEADFSTDLQHRSAKIPHCSIRLPLPTVF